MGPVSFGNSPPTGWFENFSLGELTFFTYCRLSWSWIINSCKKVRRFKVFFPVDCGGGLTFDEEDFLLMGEPLPPSHHNWIPWSQSSLGTIIICKFHLRSQIFLLYRVMKNSKLISSHISCALFTILLASLRWSDLIFSSLCICVIEFSRNVSFSFSVFKCSCMFFLFSPLKKKFRYCKIYSFLNQKPVKISNVAYFSILELDKPSTYLCKLLILCFGISEVLLKVTFQYFRWVTQLNVYVFDAIHTIYSFSIFSIYNIYLLRFFWPVRKTRNAEK